MRILLVTHYFAEHRGGVEIIAGELAKRLVERGATIEWAATGPPPEAVDPRIRPLCMKGCNLSERKLGVPYPIWGPISLLRLCRAVSRCDAVHLHDSLYVGNLVAYMKARVQGKPVVVTQHIGLVPYTHAAPRVLHSTANRTLGRLVLRGGNRVVYYSPKVEEYYRPFVRYRHAPLEIPNGVATSVFYPVEDTERQRLRRRFGWHGDRPVMLFVGRFVEKKGMHLLRRLAEVHSDLTWVFVGWGPSHPSRWNLANVQVPGSLPQHAIADYYRGADLLVLPSVGEGFPLVIQEAMACGLPVLISPDTARGARHVEEVAYTADPETAALHKRLEEILRDRAQLRQRRNAVADFATQTWNWDRCAANYYNLFTSLLDPDIAAET